jgi:SAM-dependent methyltransferase
MSKKNYNTTDLDPKTAFERHIYHRDQFAHYLRWTHVLKCMKVGDSVTDFGCGQGNLAEVLYRNRFKADPYTGLEIRKKTVEKAREAFKEVPWVGFYELDIVKAPIGFFQELPRAKHVVSFEVLEHVGKQNGPEFMDRFAACGDADSVFYLSTPNYDPAVGAAGNHTYDSGDGNGVQPQEFTHQEVQELVDRHFTVTEKFGTFASQKDYKGKFEAWHLKMFTELNKYYCSNLISVMMAPMFPEQARNTLWKMKLK